MNQQLIDEVIRAVGEKQLDKIPWAEILTTYQLASNELGHSPALAAVFELGLRQGASSLAGQ